ncbi:helix-turn-helix domain-containing protein [Candidatus Micrarchaeota archaeon]|nr:helix-turn-helix domain-containing protein [Candidatus Micrarchaeota archaeon]
MRQYDMVSLYFGAPQKRSNFGKVDGELLSEILRLYLVERLSFRRIARLLNISHMTVYRAIADPDLEVLI